MDSRPNDTVVVTGMKPTGSPHLGNFVGMMRPTLDLAEKFQVHCFIADAHALTTVRAPSRMAEWIHQIAATWLALGLNPEQTVFYRQSAVPEIFTLSWILACYTAKGLLNRAHAYKSAVSRNLAQSRDTDADINGGIYTYPILMAADILSMGADRIPVGEDQRQHIEMTRDVAAAFNKIYGPVFKLPSAIIDESIKTIPGIDGRKMSKSYGNVIPIFCSPDELKRLVMRIVTDSRRPEEVKDPDQCNLFALYRQFAPPSEVSRMRGEYLAGGIGYKAVKEALVEVLSDYFKSAHERFVERMADRSQLDRLLEAGAQTARRRAQPILEKVRQAVGLI